MQVRAHAQLVKSWRVELGNEAKHNTCIGQFPVYFTLDNLTTQH